MLPLLLSWSYHVDLTDKNSIRISEATWNLVVGDFKCSFFPLKDFFENIFFTISMLLLLSFTMMRFDEDCIVEVTFCLKARTTRIGSD